MSTRDSKSSRPHWPEPKLQLANPGRDARTSLGPGKARWPSPSSVSSLAVYRAGALGDTLLAVPALRALKSLYPAATIRLIGNREAGSVLVAAGLVTTVHSVHDPVFGALTTPLSGPDGHDGRKVIRRALGDPDLAVVYTSRPHRASSLLADLEIPHVAAGWLPPPGRHAAEHLVATLAGLVAGTAAWEGPRAISPISVPSGAPQPAVRAQGNRPAPSPPARRIVLHPGAGAAWKRWPLQHFARLASALQSNGWSVMLVEGPADAGCATAMGWAGEVARAPSLHDLAALLAGASVYVGNDSGVTHLAGLLGVPTVAIFGPTHPDAWQPLGPRVRVVRACREELRASGDVRICYDPECLQAVTPHSALEALAQVMQ